MANSPARPHTWTAQSGDEHTNLKHEAKAPLTLFVTYYPIFTLNIAISESCEV